MGQRAELIINPDNSSIHLSLLSNSRRATPAGSVEVTPMAAERQEDGFAKLPFLEWMGNVRTSIPDAN